MHGLHRSRTFAAALVVILAAGLSPVGTVAHSAPIPTARHRVVRTIPVGHEALDLAISPSGRRLYVANDHDSSISVVSTRRGRVITTYTGFAWANAVAVSPDGSRLYVSDQGPGGDGEPDSALSVVAAETGALISRIPGYWPRVQPSPDGTRLYTATYDRLRVLDTASWAVVADLPGGWGNATLSPDGTRLYAHSDWYGSADLKVLDTSTLAVVATYPLPERSSGFVLDPTGARAYVPKPDGWYVLDVATGAVVDTIVIGFALGNLAVSPVGPRLYGTYGADQASSGPWLYSVDTVRKKVVARAEVGDGSSSVVVNPAGTRAYVANSDFDSVTVVDVTLYPPSAPRTVRVKAGTGSATVSWKKPVHKGASAVREYAVTSVPGGLVCTTKGRTCTVTGLTPAASYRFQVRARNDDGWGTVRVSKALVIG
jgi:DNA-binding beta-propeller fold protein YncE